MATVGRTTAGNASDWGANTYTWVCKFTAAEAMKVALGRFYKSAADVATQSRVVVYADNGSGTDPGALLGYSEEFVGTAGIGWNEVAFTNGPTLQAGVTYWVGILMMGSADGHFDLSVQSGMTGADRYVLIQPWDSATFPSGAGTWNEQLAVYVEGSLPPPAAAFGGIFVVA